MKRLAALLATLVACAAFAQSSEIANADPKVESRLKVIAEELRCLVCQNQTIADSNAALALDLRQQARTMIAAGKSDDEIRAYMVDRYGDFVLYRPPFNAATALLWVGPPVLVVLGLAGLVVMLRRRSAAAAAAAAPTADAGKTREIEKLLSGDGPKSR